MIDNCNNDKGRIRTIYCLGCTSAFKAPYHTTQWNQTPGLNDSYTLVKHCNATHGTCSSTNKDGTTNLSAYDGHKGIVCTRNSSRKTKASTETGRCYTIHIVRIKIFTTTISKIIQVPI